MSTLQTRRPHVHEGSRCTVCGTVDAARYSECPGPRGQIRSQETIEAELSRVRAREDEALRWLQAYEVETERVALGAVVHGGPLDDSPLYNVRHRVSDGVREALGLPRRGG